MAAAKKSDTSRTRISPTDLVKGLRTMSTRLVGRVMREKMDAYEDECEVWKADCELAMTYFNFRDFLEESASLFQSLVKLDEAVRAEIYKSPDAQDFQDSLTQVDTLLRRWLNTSQIVATRLLPCFEDKFDSVEKWRAAHDEAVAMLKAPEDRFAERAQIIDLRDAAIDEFLGPSHAIGQTD